MLSAVDHLVIGVADVAEAAETYRNLGFTVTHDGDAADVGRQAAHVLFGDFHLVFPPTEGASPVRQLVLRSDDLDAEVARLRANGFDVSNPVDGPIDRRGASPPRRTAAVDSYIPFGLVEQKSEPPTAGVIAHPNTATVLERTYLAVESIDRELEMFEQLLGMPAPEPEMGTVIMSMMSVFSIGDIGIAVAEPRGPGPTEDALSANGPGLFQVLFRADHLDRAEAVMVANGVPPPRRGTRLRGESALLVEPAHACNLFVALAGQP